MGGALGLLIAVVGLAILGQGLDLASMLEALDGRLLQWLLALAAIVGTVVLVLLVVRRMVVARALRSRRRFALVPSICT